MLALWLTAGLILGAPEGVATPSPAQTRFDQVYSDVSKAAAPSEADVARLRSIYPETPYYKPYGHHGETLRRAGDQALARKDWGAVIESCQALIKAHPLDLDAHLQCAHAYKQMGAKWADHHQAMITGLLKAIVEDKDGRSVQNAWRIIDVSEAQVVLKLLALKLQSQQVQNIGDSRYSVMQVTDAEGQSFRVYFNLDIPWRWMRTHMGEQIK
ncbi:MAG: DUF4919 domain-containing protein [Bradymonadia bacterium]